MILGYDLVGDIRSDDDTLLYVLEMAGYERRNASFHHPSRKAIALGEFVEGGPGQHAFIKAVKDMVDQRDYSAVVEKRRFLIRCDLGGAYFQLHLPAEKNGDWPLAKFGRLKLTAKTTLECLAIEAIREQHRPETVTTLFIGESAPHNGTFFYCGENSMLRQMRLVMKAWKGKEIPDDSEEFLKTFKAHGWYLDDLVLCPINQLPKPERQAKCREAVEGLARRIEWNKPLAIVVLLLSIVPFVACAAIAARYDGKLHPVHFPGMGFAPHFRSDMAKIIGSLPTSKQISN